MIVSGARVRTGVQAIAVILGLGLGAETALALEDRVMPRNAAVFASIDGGLMDLAEWRGQPVLVVNTASRCGFTPQYEGLQTLQDRYGTAALRVVTVPSDSFNQELDSAEEVAAFCEINYGLDLPMAEITAVRGSEAHPFYQWLAESESVVPRWNFTKVLLDAEGAYVAHWGAKTRPTAPQITHEIDALLSP